MNTHIDIKNTQTHKETKHSQRNKKNTDKEIKSTLTKEQKNNQKK